MHVSRELSAVAAGGRIGFDTLLAHPLRTLLAILGVVLGVGSLVAVLAIMDGVGALAELQVAQYSSATTIEVRPRLPDANRSLVMPRSVGTFAAADVRSLASSLSLPASVTLIVEGGAMFRMNRHAVDAEMRAVSEGALTDPRLSISEGRFFTAGEARRGARVVVLNALMARALSGEYGSADRLLGRAVRVGNRVFVVVGVLEPIALERREIAYVPLSEPRRVLAIMSPPASWSIVLRATSIASVPPLRAELEQWLAARVPRWGETLEIHDGGEELDLLRKNMQTATLVAGAIAFITLVVGGLGVMNVLLVSVAERTREIGIRKALGARTRDVMIQFLAESVAITTGGSLIGLACGVCMSVVLMAVIRSVVKMPLFPVLSVRIVVWSVAATGAVGLLAGLYPARRASALSPTDAIRRE